MALFFYLKLAFKRLASRASLTLLLVLSIALTLGVLVCIPVFSNAVSLRLMQEELAKRVQLQKHPAFSVRIYSLPKGENPIGYQEGLDRLAWLAELVKQNLQLPLKASYMQIESRSYHLRPIKNDPRNRQTKDELDIVNVASVEGVEPQTSVITGTAIGQVPPQANPTDLPVWVERFYAQATDLQVGDRYSLGLADTNSKPPVTVLIAGIWEATDRSGLFWYRDPVYDFDKRLLTTRPLYEKAFYPLTPEKSSFAFWYFIFDESGINLDRGDFYIDALKSIQSEGQRRLPNGRMDNAPTDELARGQQRKLSLQLILAGFAAPLIATLIYFVVSMSAMAARFQRREIALLSSRGGSRFHILLLILLETVLVLIAAVPLGVGIGMGLAYGMGYSSSFLKFVVEGREPLVVYLSSVDWRIVAGGVLIATLARMIPTWRNSRVSVVAYERYSARAPETPLAVRLFLLVILMGITYYAYRQLSLKGTLGVISWRIDESSNDPLLLAAPSLFLFTAPLLLVELFSILMRPISWLGRLLPSASTYLGFMHLGREGGQYRAPSYLLVLCLTLGVFYASVAMSADAWLIERRRYEAGADLRFKPAPKPQGTSGAPVPDTSTAADPADLMPLLEYQALPGVATATFVGDMLATSDNPNLTSLHVLAVDRLAFPQVANYRRYFASHSLGEMMNRMGAQINGIVLSRKMLEQSGLKIGDTIQLNLIIAKAVSGHLTFVIADTYDYFPTFYPEDDPGAIINLDYIDTEVGGGYPIAVWMRLQPGVAGADIVTQVESHRLVTTELHDLRATITDDQQRLERVGIFGLLSICFLTGAILSGIGILIYSLSSMAARAQRFAALRAMGMRQSAVVRTVVIEYVVTLGYGLLAGTGLGIAASALYVPMFPLTDNPVIPIPPFVPLIDWQRAMWMAGVMGVTLALIITAVLIKVARERIFEVLRMGAE